MAFPTDTLYGLGVDAFNPKAVQRLFDIKSRTKDMALPLLLADAHDISSVAVDVPQMTWDLAKKFLPGPLTILVQKNASVPDIITAGSSKVAVRVPDHAVPRSLARELGRPITGTSANISGEPSATTVSEVVRQLGTTVDFIIDGGPCSGDIPSTVVDVTEEGLHILREGAISKAELEEACGQKVTSQ